MTSPATTAPAPDADLPRHLVPHRVGFVVPRVLGAALPFGLIGLFAGVGLYVASLIDLPLAVAVALGPAALFTALGYWLAGVAFRKERYELHASHLRAQRGTILSDTAAELDIRNITHVKLRLPWLRYKFLGVGDVMVESAGSGASQIRLRSIDQPELVYEQIRRLMQHNGYSLRREELLHLEQPDQIGVIVECLGLFAGVAVGLLITLAEVFGALGGGGSMTGWAGVMAAVAGLTVLGGTITLTIHYLDMRRRTYRVFADTVVYEEGFLTRDNAFIPYENIADANSKRNLLDLLLGLYDVQVSCQGSGSEISFRRLRNGHQLAAAIDRLVEAAREAPRPAQAPSLSAREGDGEEAVPVLAPARREPQLVPADQAWTAELRIDMARALVPMIPLFPLFPLWIGVLIRAAFTRFSVRAHSVRTAFSFLHATEREFTYGKITGLVIKTNPWDHLFNTVSVRLWSIGAPEPIDLLHIRRDQIDLDALLAQVGIPPAEPAPGAEGPLEVQARFGPLGYVVGRLPQVALLTLLAAASIAAGVLVDGAFFGFLILGVLGFVPWLAYLWAYYARQRLWFYPQHVRAETGLLWRSRYHARYANVKKVMITRYPDGDLGRIRIYVAGEHRIGAQQGGQPGQGGKKQGAPIPYAFTADFLPRVEQYLTLVDDLLLERVQPSPDVVERPPLEPLHESRPHVANAMVRLLLPCVIVVPLILFLPIAIPWTWMVVHRWRYRVEAGRVVSSWGLLYLRQLSVTFDSIDSLSHGQAMLGKMFGNGRVTLYTAGSSAPDLVVRDIPDYQAFYDVVREHYGQR